MNTLIAQYLMNMHTFEFPLISIGGRLQKDRTVTENNKDPVREKKSEEQE